MTYFHADATALLEDLVPFASKMLSEEGAFLPFGGCIRSDGTLVWEGASTDDDHPPSRELIAILHGNHTKLAAAGEIRACAVLYDTLATPPGQSSKQDSICVALDHFSGQSMHFVYPYVIDPSGLVSISDPYVLDRSSNIFPGRNA